MAFGGRDISVEVDGYEIAISARLASWKDASAAAVLRLYIDGKLEDEAKGSVLLGLFGERYVLRGQLPLQPSATRTRLVKVVCTNSALQRPLYEIYLDDKLIHSQKGIWGSF